MTTEHGCGGGDTGAGQSDDLLTSILSCSQMLWWLLETSRWWKHGDWGHRVSVRGFVVVSHSDQEQEGLCHSETSGPTATVLVF